MEKLSMLLLVTAVLCTLITIITEFTKETKLLKKIPTAFQVLITSIIVCETALFAYLTYAKIHVVWYYPVAVFFAAFIIAIICTRGWEYLIEIWKRFYKNSDSVKIGQTEDKNDK